MDCDEYRQVWIEKFKDDPDKDPDKTVDNEDIDQYDSDDNVYDLPTAAYRTDLAKHKLVWTGHFWSDQWFYIKQEHPLLSICMSQKVHPLGRWERFFIELFVFALTSMWAASATIYIAQVRREENTTSDWLVNQTAWWGYSILGGLIKTVVNSILKMVATCTCYQEENTRARVKCELAGYFCMAVWAVISLGLLGLGLYFVYLADKEEERSWSMWLVSLIISYVSGWIISFVITFLTYLFLYGPCKTYDYKFGFIVNYQDYLNWYDEYGEQDEISGGSKRMRSYEKVSQNEMTTNHNGYQM